MGKLCLGVEFGLEKEFDRLMNQVSQLLEVVHDSCPILEKVDMWVWKDDEFQVF